MLKSGQSIPAGTDLGLGDSVLGEGVGALHCMYGPAGFHGVCIQPTVCACPRLLELVWEAVLHRLTSGQSCLGVRSEMLRTVQRSRGSLSRPHPVLTSQRAALPRTIAWRPTASALSPAFSNSAANCMDEICVGRNPHLAAYHKYSMHRSLKD